MTRKEYWYWLCNIPGFGAIKLKQLMDHYESPEILFHISSKELEKFQGIREKDRISWENSKKKFNFILEQYHNLYKKNIRFVTLEDEEYPNKLKEIYDRPFGLYVKGKLPSNARPAVAIIGARSCTEYGKEMARYFGYELARAGVSIISGMAVGIDCNGQSGAIEGGGETYAILGSGVDVCYPPENISLYMETQKSGGVISEFMLGMKGLPHLFPMRNRIISGISDCVIIIEAREKSGSLITADQALEQGREIYALPGRINDPLSVGCNTLIKTGANILTSPADVLEFLHIAYCPKRKKTLLKRPPLTKEEFYFLQFVGKEETHLEIILGKTGLPLGSLMKILLQLELKGYIDQPIKNYYRNKE